MPNGDAGSYHHCPSIADQAIEATRQIKEHEKTIRDLENKIETIEKENCKMKKALDFIRGRMGNNG